LIFHEKYHIIYHRHSQECQNKKGVHNTMKQTFTFEGVTGSEQRELTVVAQMSYKYDAMAIQISKVKVEGEIRYVYEEVDVHTDEVIMCRYMGESNIRKNFPWAVTLLPLVNLTTKQVQVMRCALDEAFEDGNELTDRIFVVNDFVEVAHELTGMKPKAIEGILSSLWVKGYITMAVFVGPGTRYFTIDAFGKEFLKDATPLERVEMEDEEEEYDEEAGA